MPGPLLQFVRGSFITSAAWTVRGESGSVYHIMSGPGEVSFRVTKNGTVTASREGGWKQWWEDGVRVYYKQSTVYVRANGCGRSKPPATPSTTAWPAQSRGDLISRSDRSMERLV